MTIDKSVSLKLIFNKADATIRTSFFYLLTYFQL